ncbi:MAG TPA: PQQ-dependent sugar dehydrogenase [Candidatus Thermoplasmatota archaeon]|nr:PQQ-dependent sugar dehydrogenase [Candidatus Thermoplasmatota archaeon]
MKAVGAGMLLLVAALANAGAHGTSGDAHVEIVASGLLEPVHVAFDGVDPSLLYISERAGRVLMFDLDTNDYVRDALGQPKAFLDLRGLAGTWFLEMGLLSIAFHPDHASNGYVYVGWVDQLMVNHLDRFTRSSLDPQTVDLLSRSPVLTQVGDVFPNHNGGGAVFGPDGYLYYAIGDGGLANDPFDYGQDTSTWFGKLLRLDVDSVESGYAVPPDNPFGDGELGAPEIWAYGLRNPWRFSFDGNDLWIGDVGQNQWEEIDHAPGNPGGINWGWPLYEGSHPYLTSAHVAPAPPTPPVVEYSHSEGCSVTGGHVYRGSDPALAHLVGKYVFGDYCSRTLWSFSATAGRQVLVGDSRADISSLAEGPDGTLYVVALGLQSEPLGGWVGRLSG